MSKVIRIIANSQAICPNCSKEGCEECDQTFHQMIGFNSVENDSKARMCSCGFFWTPRLCQACVRLEYSDIPGDQARDERCIRCQQEKCFNGEEG